VRTPAWHLTNDGILALFSRIHRLTYYSVQLEGLVIDARGGTVSEDALLGASLTVFPHE
jgi:hypothetical protein